MGMSSRVELPRERVYARILARVDREALDVMCRETAQREAATVERRVRGAQRALQHVYDVEAACQTLPALRAHLRSAACTTELLADLQQLQSTIALRMKQLAGLVANKADTHSDATSESVVDEPQAPEQEPDDTMKMKEEEEICTPSPRKGKRRRLRQDSVDSPRKPPRPGRLALMDSESTEEENDEPFPTATPSRRSSTGGPHGGPHEMPSATDDEETEDDLPMELDVLDSDAEFEMASYLEKARRLRKISSERRMGELPALIKAVLAEINRHDWSSMPRELLGTLSATFGAATTLKPQQRSDLKDELLALQTIALLIDESSGRRYPTLLGSSARFLSSMDGIHDNTIANPPSTSDAAEGVFSAHIEGLYAATTALAQRGDASLKSMEQIDELLTLVDHVFDNPTLARSPRYRAMVASSLDVLIAHCDAMPRTTRRSLQCLEALHRRRAELL